MAIQTSNRMAGSFFAVLSLLSLVTGLEVLFPAGGNIWDLDEVNSYNVLWKSANTDPTHVHVAIHDAAGNVFDSYESVKTSSGSYLISGLSEMPSGSNYQIVLSDSATPKRKIVARSGKFSIRQHANSASSSIPEDIAPTSTQPTPQVTVSIISPPLTTQTAVTGIGLLTSLTSASSSLQTTTKRTPTASKTYPSLTSSSHTGISTQTSTGFPKFVLPSQRGLSKGTKIGISVGVAILLLISLGVCIFFRRRKQRQQQDVEIWNDEASGMATPATHDGHAAEAGYHGKPELVGDPARLFGYDSSVGYVQKPELETHSSITSGSESNDQRNEVHLVPVGVAELPQQAGMQAVPLGMTELPQRSTGQTPVYDRTAAEIDSTSPHPHHHGTDNAQARSLYGTENEECQYQYQNQHAVELPVGGPTRIARKSIPSPQSSRAALLSPREELPAASTILPASSPLPLSAQFAAPAAPSSQLPPLPSQEEATDDKLEILRRRERNIAESISAAEAIERLRREQFEIQERIRIGEERAQMAISRGKG